MTNTYDVYCERCGHLTAEITHSCDAELTNLREENERLKNEVAHDLGFTGHIDEINNEEKIVYVLIEDRYELGLPLELFKNPFKGQFIEFRQITRKWTKEEIETARERGKELHEFFDRIPRPEGDNGQ
jgi:hypothetical protein